jgi:hypothetical protein
MYSTAESKKLIGRTVPEQEWQAQFLLDWNRDRRIRIIYWTSDEGQHRQRPSTLAAPEWDEEIIHAIDASRWILGLRDDFDGEGSEGYAEKTWKRAVEFLRRHARWVWETASMKIQPPRIRPGPSGSIDLHWKTPSYELLLNIPANPAESATFYGDDYGRSTVEGSFDPSAFNTGILTWLSTKK